MERDPPPEPGYAAAPPDPAARPSRVAVVVVAGVGDRPEDDAAATIAAGLTLHAGFTPPTRQLEVLAIADDPGGTHRGFVRYVVADPPTGVLADVVELWWADLSRFPRALRSFLAAFVGLFLEISAIARVATSPPGALTPTGRRSTEPQPARAAVANRLAAFLGWWLASPIVVCSGVVLAAVVAAVVSLLVREHGPYSVAAVAAYGLAALVLGMLACRRYQRSGRSWAMPVAELSALLGMGIGGYRGAVRSGEADALSLALADTASWLVAYPLRIVWLAALAAATALTLTLAWCVVRTHDDDPHGPTRRIAASALVGTAVGPLGLALLVAVISAAIGALGERAKRVTWPSAPIELDSAQAWVLGSSRGTRNAWAWGQDLLASAITPLVLATATAIAVALLLVLVLLPGLHRGKGGWVRPVVGLVETKLGLLVLFVGGGAILYATTAGWLPVWRGPLDTVASATTGSAAIAGGLAGALVLAARLGGLTPSALAGEGKAAGLLSAILDKPYDVATFLAEPFGWRGVKGEASARLRRARIAHRFGVLMRQLTRDGDYERVVFAAHSQGTVITTMMLSRPGSELPTPPAVSLLTFGCPLRQLYLRRFPGQFGWVADLADPSSRQEYVHRVTERWVNVAAPSDAIGRSVFARDPDPWCTDPEELEPGSPALKELRLERGGHAAYWEEPEVYAALRELIVAPLAAPLRA